MRMKKKMEAGSSIPNSSEETPLLVRNQNRKVLSSQAKTFANIFIAIVGAGVLGLPYTFKVTGWLASLVMLFSVAFITQHCLMLLVHTRRRLVQSRQSVDDIGSYGDLGFAVFGPVGRVVVDILIILSQAGFCVGYLIFISNTLVNLLGDGLTSLTSKGFYISICFPFQLGLNSIRTLTHLAPLSMVADIVDFCAKGVVMIKEIVVLTGTGPEVYAFGSFSAIFYGLGVFIFAFEGAGLVLPIESEMKEREKFGRVLGMVMALIAVLYGLFGLLGYLAFGNETKDLITGNLGSGLVSSLVQFGLCVNLFFTFPVMMNPVYEIMERRLCGGRYCLWMRWVAVLLISLTALFVPNFADFLSLVGSSVCSGLGFVLPASCHLMVFKDEIGWRGWSADVSIVILGLLFTIFGTWSSIYEIISAKA